MKKSYFISLLHLCAPQFRALHSRQETPLLLPRLPITQAQGTR